MKVFVNITPPHSRGDVIHSQIKRAADAVPHREPVRAKVAEEFPILSFVEKSLAVVRGIPGFAEHPEFAGKAVNKALVACFQEWCRSLAGPDTTHLVFWDPLGALRLPVVQWLGPEVVTPFLFWRTEPHDVILREVARLKSVNSQGPPMLGGYSEIIGHLMNPENSEVTAALLALDRGAAGPLRGRMFGSLLEVLEFLDLSFPATGPGNTSTPPAKQEIQSLGGEVATENSLAELSRMEKLDLERSCLAAFPNPYRQG